MERAEQDGGRRGAKRPEEQGRDDGGEEEEAQGSPKRRRRFRPGLGLQINMENQRSPILHKVVNFAPDPLPARQYDRRTTEPISFYLVGLEELLAWNPTKDDAFNVSTEPLAKRQPPLDSHRPRTLVCHDMKGGYLEDRFIQGAVVREPYVFYHWRYIDIFVYFSHRTVTIPPVVWTNAAHRNGVLMLGTFISEWTDGAKMCESFLASEEAYRAVAEQLAAIAQFYRFDGWLVNIENTLSVEAARNAPHFLRYLTAQVHKVVPGGQVVWYDSILQNGELKWQNELNGTNRVYFDACDGFFTNYNWKEEHLLRTREMADDRRIDVYVGLDVFGRGDVVGSGFDSNKALRMIREHGLSVAIFAPGWVYEHLGATDFLKNEDKFWGLLAEMLPVHSIASLPFITAFSLGMGEKHFYNGEVRSTEPWYNLSAQEIQPLYTDHSQPKGGQLRTQCCLQDAWCGGSSLLLEGTIPPDVSHVKAKLNYLQLFFCIMYGRPFVIFFLCSFVNFCPLVSFTIMMLAPSKLFLVLIYKEETIPQAVTVTPELATRESPSCPSSDGSALPQPRWHAPSRVLRLPPHIAQLLRGCGQDAAHGWKSRCYELKLQRCFLEELSITVSRRQSGHDEVPFACRLGKIWVLDAAAFHSESPSASPVSPLETSHVHWQPASAGKLSLSLTLHWTYPPSKATCFRVHYRSGSSTDGPGSPLLLIGEAYAPLYRVIELMVPEAHPGSPCRLEFLVEPVPDDGIQIDTAMWGKLTFVYTAPQLPSPGTTV